MAGSVEVLWLGTAVSFSVLCFVAVLMMAKWRPRKAGAVGGGRAKSEEQQLEIRVKELERTGDLDGAAALLLSAWTTKGSSRAVTLAHELSQRYPKLAFQVGCPVQQGNRASGLAPRREQEHDAGDYAADDSTPATSAVSTSEAVAPTTGSGTAPERGSGQDDERGSPSATLSPESTSSGGGGEIAITEAAPSVGPNDKRDGRASDGETPSPSTPPTNTTTTTPWERGWQGPEGFKPPPTLSSSNSSSATAANRTPSPDIGSTSLSSRKRGVEESDLGGDQAGVTRNFTISQLNAFDGGVPAPVVRGGVIKAKEARPIYIALRGEVYDASAGRHLYGPGGEYSEFAGHDISRRVARGIRDAAGTSTDIAPLDDLSLQGLDRFEKMTLRGWEDTFKARGYPRVGRVVTLPPPRLFSRAELRAFDGRSAAGAGSERAGGDGRSGEETGVHGEGKGTGGAGAAGEAVPGSVPVPVTMPAGYAARPIYMGVRDKVFDVSFGGSEFYVDGGPYECLAGRDASRVLAKMSMKPEDVDGVLDYASLSAREEKNLADWVEKLGEGEGGRGYPVVGWIDLDLDS